MSDDNGFNDYWKKDLYRFLFPTIKKSGPAGPQDVFSEYGCAEAVNVELIESSGEHHVTSKKDKLLLESDISARFFVPTQPILPLTCSEVRTLLYEADFNDFFTNRCLTSSDKGHRSSLFMNTDLQLCNLASDHPDVYHGTFLKLMSQYFPYQADKTGIGYVPNFKTQVECGFKSPKKFLQPHRLGRAAKNINQQLNPMLLDVPKDVVNDCLLEEISTQTKSLSYDPQDTGGCISFQRFSKLDAELRGLLVSPQGENMDQLTLQLLSTQSQSKFDNSDEENRVEFDPKLVLGTSYRCLLNGTILQTEAVAQHSSSACIVGVRCHYNALMLSVDATSVCSDNQDNYKLKFESEDCVRKLGALQSTSLISSISVNPYIPGESVVTTYDNQMFVWNTQRQAHVDKQKSQGILSVNLGDTFISDESKWLQTAYASHPRQLYVANRRGVYSVDVRTKTSSPSRLMHTPDDLNFKDEMIMAILGGTHFQPDKGNSGNEFQCVVATQSNLLLLDQRYCKAPLLQWCLTLRSPCQHLASTTFLNHNQLTSLIVAANQRPQELHCFHANSNLSTVFDSHRSARVLQRDPPTSICHPRALGSLKHVSLNVAKFPIPRFRRDVLRRLERPVAGIAAFSYRDRGGRNGAVILQATSCGDVFYQSLKESDLSAEYEIGNITTGLTGYSVRAAEKRAKSEAAESLYREWADEVARSFARARAEGPTSRSVQPSINSVNCKVDADFVKTVFSSYHKNPSDDCVLCGETCSHQSDGSEDGVVESTSDVKAAGNSHEPEPQESGSWPDSSDDDEFWSNAQPMADPKFPENKRFCPRCNVEMGFGSDVVQCHRVGAPFASRRANMGVAGEACFADDDSPVDIPRLSLIDTSHVDDHLGRVLVSTWDKTYEDLWNELREERVEWQERKRQEASIARFDIQAAGQENSENHHEVVNQPSVSTASDACVGNPAENPEQSNPARMLLAPSISDQKRPSCSTGIDTGRKSRRAKKRARRESAPFPTPGLGRDIEDDLVKGRRAAEDLLSSNAAIERAERNDSEAAISCLRPQNSPVTTTGTFPPKNNLTPESPPWFGSSLKSGFSGLKSPLKSSPSRRKSVLTSPDAKKHFKQNRGFL